MTVLLADSDFPISCSSGSLALQQVTQSIVVNLYKTCGEGELPALLLQFPSRFKHLLHCPWNDSPAVFRIFSLHGVSFATARLAICKTTNVVTIQGRLYEQGDLFKDLEEEQKIKSKSKHHIKTGD